MKSIRGRLPSVHTGRSPMQQENALDLITQGLLGATLAQTASRRAELGTATAVGLVAGLLPDADILIRSSGDSLLNLEYHRHFTHSLIFIPLGGFIAALLAWPFVRQRLHFPRLYLYALLGYGLSGLLDASTSYGTYLFWPFNDTRVAWNIISIIDPVFTLPLLLATLFGLRRRSAVPARIGLLLAAAYLTLGWQQHERGEQAAKQLARERGHGVQRMVVKPTLGNLILWRSVYLSEDRFHVDAIRLSLAGPPRVYPGGSLPHLQPQADTRLAAGSRLQRDALRFDRFSDGFLVQHPRHPEVLGDIRYAMLPDSLEPLWGIRLNLQQPEQHARYETFRDTSRQSRQRFLSMLTGKAE